MQDRVSPFGTAPPGRLLGGPAGTKAYLRYARENAGRSRKLFKDGDMRYAVFSANEGLEICVKGFLLHYKIMTKSERLWHLPYPLLVAKLREFLESLRGLDRAHPGLLDLIRGKMDEHAGFSQTLADKGMRIALWRWSMGIPPGPGEQKRFDQIEEVVRWMGGPPSGPREGSGPPGPGGTAEEGPRGYLADILGLFHKRAAARRSFLRAAPWYDGGMQDADLLRLGQMVAHLEVLYHLPVVVGGYAHQQISRYPTPIGGVDSGDLYMRHRGGVGRLLERLYGASGMLMGHLDASSAPILRSSAALRRLGVLHA